MKSMPPPDRFNNFAPIFLLFLTGFVLFRSMMEFYMMAWGTGTQIGNFSLTWLALFVIYVLFCVILLACAIVLIWRYETAITVVNRFRAFREARKWLCLPIAFFCLIFPAWLLQYTIFGMVFYGPYIRIVIWLISTLLFSMLITQGDKLVGWSQILTALILSTSIFSILEPLKNAHDYPFSLGWSEGNRIWDYSIMFGQNLYDYPQDRPISVLLDKGRQFVGGLPFLLPGLSITMERLWLGIIQIVPYFFVGILAFRKFSAERAIWILSILWTFLFLSQGPIHTPLVLCAALTLLAWRNPFWFAIPIIIIAGYFAQLSRFTWLFAPGIWIVMLEFASAPLLDDRIDRRTWFRSALLGLSGLFGGYLLPKLLAIMNVTITAANLNLEDVGEVIGNSGLTAEQVSNEVTHQPLLWYRLLPNSTYGNGILIGLFIATAPLLIVLLHLLMRKYWKINIWRKLSLILPMIAFLVVGLIASTKIGGGGDLHNMDMFLIAVFLAAVIALHNGGMTWIKHGELIPQWMKIMIVLWFVVSSVTSLINLRPYTFGNYASWLKTITDAPSEAALGMLPTSTEVDNYLNLIQSEVDQAKVHGEVLFIDQRQLLTFGYIKDVPFVPEYEKKLLMNEALASNEGYFKAFHADISAQRFSLIVSEPLRTPVQDSSFEFGEENNAWVKWVSVPVLCYYEPVKTIKSIRVQLLIPKTDVENCAAVFPSQGK